MVRTERVQARGPWNASLCCDPFFFASLFFLRSPETKTGRRPRGRMVREKIDSLNSGTGATREHILFRNVPIVGCSIPVVAGRWSPCSPSAQGLCSWPQWRQRRPAMPSLPGRALSTTARPVCAPLARPAGAQRSEGVRARSPDLSLATPRALCHAFGARPMNSARIFSGSGQQGQDAPAVGRATGARLRATREEPVCAGSISFVQLAANCTLSCVHRVLRAPCGRSRQGSRAHVRMSCVDRMQDATQS